MSEDSIASAFQMETTGNVPTVERGQLITHCNEEGQEPKAYEGC